MPLEVNDTVRDKNGSNRYLYFVTEIKGDKANLSSATTCTGGWELIENLVKVDRFTKKDIKEDEPMSETKTIYSALLEAQKTVTNLKKNKQGYGYNYGDLTQLLELYRTHFLENGLIVMQGHSAAAEGQICVVTTIVYAPTGEELAFDFYCPLDKQGGPQGAGSATTYARRYALEGIMGISHEDDDGAAAMPKKPQQPTKAKTPSKPPAVPKQQTAKQAALALQITKACEILGIDIKKYATDNQFTYLSSEKDLELHATALNVLVSKKTSNTLSEAEMAAIEEYAA
jgi:hypothetical protein